jgi:hypothetical protein
MLSNIELVPLVQCNFADYYYYYCYYYLIGLRSEESQYLMARHVYSSGMKRPWVRNKCYCCMWVLLIALTPIHTHTHTHIHARIHHSFVKGLLCPSKSTDEREEISERSPTILIISLTLKPRAPSPTADPDSRELSAPNALPCDWSKQQHSSPYLPHNYIPTVHTSVLKL